MQGTLLSRSFSKDAFEDVISQLSWVGTMSVQNSVAQVLVGGTIMEEKNQEDIL